MSSTNGCAWRASSPACHGGRCWPSGQRSGKCSRDSIRSGWRPSTRGDVDRLLQDARIIRHRRKIEATITNARAVLALHESGIGLRELFWALAALPEAARKPVGAGGFAGHHTRSGGAVQTAAEARLRVRRADHRLRAPCRLLRDRQRPPHRLPVSGRSGEERQQPGVDRAHHAASARAGRLRSVDVLVVDHPLAAVRLTMLRDERHDRAVFRAALSELATDAGLRGHPRTATRSRCQVRTPLTVTEGAVIADPPLLVPVLRAGLGMAEAACGAAARGADGFRRAGARRAAPTSRAPYLESIPDDLTGRSGASSSTR